MKLCKAKPAREAAAKAAQRRVDSGPEAQALVALVLLVRRGAGAAAAAARRIADDPRASAALRRDAFQTLLFTLEPGASRRQRPRPCGRPTRAGS